MLARIAQGLIATMLLALMTDPATAARRVALADQASARAALHHLGEQGAVAGVVGM